MTINAILGEAGLAPTLAALSASKRLALSNKESLVIAGEIVMAKAKATGCQLIPVDSEHSAIFQCLEGNARADVRSILLTASGGPFFGYTKAQLQSVSLADTLAHPTWKMGKKITVDSATLMNKGFEVIEAVHLFGVDVGQINVVVHRESIIHSAVEYADMSVIAQMALPDMRSCVSYALTYPRRTEGVCAPLDLTSIGTLTFAKPDTDTFPLLPLAKFAIGEGGAVPACVNAANEEAVAAFLSEQIRFCQMAEVVEEAVHATLSEAKSAVALDDILYCASLARDKALQIISNHRSA